MNDAAAAPVISVTGLTKHYRLGRSLRSPAGGGRVVQAVTDVDLEIRRGETLGLIGESGSGKSTLGRTMLRLVEPTAGSAVFDGVDLLGLSRPALRDIRRRMGVVFQNPHSAVNRRRRVRAIVAEPLKVHGIGTRAERAGRARRSLELAGLSWEFESRYPPELSGGQVQRVAIARALAAEPEFILADEPTASLDVSVRAQIINLFADLKAELGLAMLFISHDLATVSYLADRVAVLYLGRVVELAPMEAIAARPLHPYTQALIASIPSLDPADRKAAPARGQIPSAVAPPPGCAYHPRCPLRMPICSSERPPLEMKDGGHLVACHAVPVDPPVVRPAATASPSSAGPAITDGPTPAGGPATTTGPPAARPQGQ